jgi:broad specificity phosphatase PhoE
MGTLVVVRHGQASLFAADYDELSPRGMTQAQLLGVHMREHGPHPDFVFSGPAKRQRETARLCGESYAHGGRTWPSITVVPELDEHDAFGMIGKAVPRLRGDAEIDALANRAESTEDPRERSAAFQRLFEAVMTRWLRGELDDPGIETWKAFADRVDRALDRMVALDKPGRRLLAFTSVGPLAVMLRRALGTADIDAFRTAWRIRNASVTTFVFRGKQFTLDAFNAMPHQPDAAGWTFR